MSPDLIMAEFWGPPMWPHGRAWIWAMLVLLLMCMWSGMVRTSPRLLTRYLNARPAITRLVKTGGRL